MMILIVERGSGFSVQADVVTQRRTPCLLESLTQPVRVKVVVASVMQPSLLSFPPGLPC